MKTLGHRPRDCRFSCLRMSRGWAPALAAIGHVGPREAPTRSMGGFCPASTAESGASRAPAFHRLRSSPRALREFCFCVCFCFCRRSPSRRQGSWPSRWALWARRWRRLPRALQGLQSSPNDRSIINLYISSAGCGSPFDTGRSFAWRGFPPPAFKISTRSSAGFAIDQKLGGRALLLSERARHDGIGCGEGAKRPGAVVSRALLSSSSVTQRVTRFKPEAFMPARTSHSNRRRPGASTDRRRPVTLHEMRPLEPPQAGRQLASEALRRTDVGCTRVVKSTGTDSTQNPPTWLPYVQISGAWGCRAAWTRGLRRGLDAYAPPGLRISTV